MYKWLLNLIHPFADPSPEPEEDKDYIRSERIKAYDQIHEELGEEMQTVRRHTQELAEDNDKLGQMLHDLRETRDEGEGTNGK